MGLYYAQHILRGLLRVDKLEISIILLRSKLPNDLSSTPSTFNIVVTINARSNFCGIPKCAFNIGLEESDMWRGMSNT